MKYRLSTLLITVTFAAFFIHEVTTVVEQRSEFSFRFVSSGDAIELPFNYWLGLSLAKPASETIQSLSEPNSTISADTFQRVLHFKQFPTDGLEFSVSGRQLHSPLLNRDLGVRLDEKHVSLLIRHQDGNRRTYKAFSLNPTQREIDADLLLLMAQIEI